MEPIKVNVKSVKNLSGQVSLAPVKDTVISEKMTAEGLEKVTLKKDVVFYSVSPVDFENMSKPKSVLAWIHLGKLYCKPII